MISAIGVMIGGYIIFRCIEIACRSEAQFSSAAAQTTVRVFAILCILVTALFTLDIFFGGSQGLAIGGGSLLEPSSQSTDSLTPEQRRHVDEQRQRQQAEELEQKRREIQELIRKRDAK